MTPIEILAVVFSVLILVKLAFVLANPQLAVKISEPLLKRKALCYGAYAVMAVVAGYFVLDYFSMAEIAAVLLFGSFLYALSALTYADSLMGLTTEITQSRETLLRRAWLPIAIWVVMAVWTLASVFLEGGSPY